jgi:hypothetical protein
MIIERTVAATLPRCGVREAAENLGCNICFPWNLGYGSNHGGSIKGSNNMM